MVNLTDLLLGYETKITQQKKKVKQTMKLKSLIIICQMISLKNKFNKKIQKKNRT
jgi:hypothetical protein